MLGGCHRSGDPTTPSLVASRRSGSAPPADSDEGQFLLDAVFGGAESVVHMLLTSPRSAPRADCRRGDALIWAARSGHSHLVKLLLEWPEHSPRADCRDGSALIEVRRRGQARGLS